MDTRFWGPSGWKLLHHATFVYITSDKKAYDKFFESIPYILPCKYCRASLTDNYEKEPVNLDSQAKLVHWLYKIHNLVNGKLRGQGIHAAPNPSLDQVKTTYHTWLAESTPYKRLQTFWDFLFAVAYNHPKEASRSSKPMPECPPQAHTCADPCVRNKWNTLPADKRFKWYEQFWDTLPAALGPELEGAWRKAEEKTHRDFSCRRSAVAWLWRMRCALDAEFKDPYTAICKRIASYSSECGRRRAKTCRKTRRNS